MLIISPWNPGSDLRRSVIRGRSRRAGAHHQIFTGAPARRAAGPARDGNPPTCALSRAWKSPETESPAPSATRSPGVGVPGPERPVLLPAARGHQGPLVPHRLSPASVRPVEGGDAAGGRGRRLTTPCEYCAAAHAKGTGMPSSQPLRVDSRAEGRLLRQRAGKAMTMHSAGRCTGGRHGARCDGRAVGELAHAGWSAACDAEHVRCAEECSPSRQGRVMPGQGITKRD